MEEHMKLLKVAAFLLSVFLVAGCSKGSQGVQFKDQQGASKELLKGKKIALVQSYWTNYKWGIDIEKGVLQALNAPQDVLNKPLTDKGGLGIKEGIVSTADNVEVTLKIICMDTKRRSDAGWKKEAGTKTIAELDAFKPDVVILADDNAQTFVGKLIVNKYPIVYNGVNNDFKDYYSPGDQVTGLNERMNFVETAQMIKEIYKNVDKLVLITDMTETSKPVVAQLKETKLPFSTVEAYQYDKFDDMKKKVAALQAEKNTAIGIFNLNFKDMPQEKAIAWIVQNSKLPEMAFQTNVVQGGILLASAVSGVYHGIEAVQKALLIIRGTKASDIPVSVPLKGEVIVNQARAKMLGVDIPISILNASEVYNQIDTLK
jgi:ABC-type uncharacterized transport system substrate-binding protein